MQEELELEFDEPGWRRAIDALPAGGMIPVQHFFALLGDVTEDEAAEAAAALAQRHIAIAVSQLPPCCEGASAERLSLERELAAAGKLPHGLAANDPLRLHWQSIERLPKCTEVGLTGSSGSRTEGLLYLVLEEAPAFAGQGVLLLDLMQEGTLGLMQAMDLPADCDAEQVRWHIRQSMAQAVALQYFVSGGAQRLVAAMREYQQADRRLLEKLGRNPAPEELAQELGKPLSQVELLGKMVENAGSVSRPQPTPEAAPESVAESAYFQLRSRVDALLSSLHEQDRQLLSLRFGLSENPPMTQQEAARQLGITAEEAQRRELAAISLLRQQEGQ